MSLLYVHLDFQIFLYIETQPVYNNESDKSFHYVFVQCSSFVTIELPSLEAWFVIRTK